MIWQPDAFPSEAMGTDNDATGRESSEIEELIQPFVMKAKGRSS